MEDMHSHPSTHVSCSSCEEAMNLYLDGELEFHEQPALFTNLAVCDECREQFNAVMLFREASRQERIVLPPTVDEAFFKRLAERRSLKQRVNRYEDRRPLWQLQRPFSVRTAVCALSLFFILGVFFQGGVARSTHASYVHQEEELVDFGPGRTVPHYVVWPGLTVEESRILTLD